MTHPADFCDALTPFDIDFFCGVPDSLLKGLCAYVDDTFDSQQHIITANEGNSIAMAAGYHLTTGRSAMVYMQNSGLGNAVNPLTSLADPQVYSVPMLLVIGWRAEPGIKDEPQHIKQGAISEEMLKVLDIPYIVLDKSGLKTSELNALLSQMQAHQRPVAILVKKGSFQKYKQLKSLDKPTINTNTRHADLSREQALEVLLDNLPSNALIVSTTGKTSRELFELRQKRKEACADFLTVGAMGHASSIAMGAALGNPDRLIVVVDGDGAMLMHMGALPIIGCHQINNLVHIVLNNACHESVGGQATVADQIDIPMLAKASNYVDCEQVQTAEQIKHAIARAMNRLQQQADGACMIEVKVRAGSREDLGRPTSTPIENKTAFMNKAND
jgi:phosphonopyruvate decarboxylase